MSDIGSMSKLTDRVTRATRQVYSLIFERTEIRSENGMGIELIERDGNFLKFVESLIIRPQA